MSWGDIGKIAGLIITIAGILILVGRKFEWFRIGNESSKKTNAEQQESIREIEKHLQRMELALKDKVSLPDCEKSQCKCGESRDKDRKDICHKIDMLANMISEGEQKRCAAKKDIEEWNRYVGRVLGRVEQFMLGKESGNVFNNAGPPPIGNGLRENEIIKIIDIAVCKALEQNRQCEMDKASEQVR